jgi:hypothetical protein
MTTENDDVRDRIVRQGESNVTQQGVPEEGFSDPESKYPKSDYEYEASTNKGSRGSKIHNLSIKNSVVGKVATTVQQEKSVYPLSQTNESISGHVIEINDTPGGERILIKHNTGAGIEIRSDGSIVINSLSNRLDVVAADYVFAVEGEGNITYYGNLNMTVQGNYNLEVKGDYNVKVSGNKILTVLGSYRKKIMGAFGEIIFKTKSSTVLDKVTNTYLKDFGNFVKGTYRNLIDGESTYASSKRTSFTSEVGIDISSLDVNVAGNNLSVFGDEGTVGGKNITMFSQNSYVEKTLHSETVQASQTMKARVFHGNLNGTAKGAERAGTAARGPGWGGSVPSVDHNPADPLAAGTVAKPDDDILDSYLKEDEKGIKEVRIDRDNSLFNTINQAVKNGDVSDKPLTTSEVRSKLKNSNNLNNSKFIQNQISRGTLSPNFAAAAPSSVGRVRNQQQTARTGVVTLGTDQLSVANKRYLPRESSSRNVYKTVIPDPQYNPQLQSDITLQTKLAKSVPISKFVSALGDSYNLDHTKSVEERKQIARNLVPQADVINIFYSLQEFNGYNLVVSEGLYKPYEKEKIDDNSPKGLARSGRFVVYEVYDANNGSLSYEKTFDFASYLKDNSNYEKISLYYDTFDPSGKTHAQIGITMPQIPETYQASFNKSIETVYNGRVQSNSDLLEILS